MEMSQMTPRRPYLLRAFYDWLLDNQLTPHLVVDVSYDNVDVPMEFVNDGQIVLNVAPRAVGNLSLADDAVSFNARFGGVPRQVYVPMAAVMAIYARENGAGTMFEPEPGYDDIAFADDIFDGDDKPRMSAVDNMSMDEPESTQEGDDEPTPPRRRPTFRVVK